MGNKYGIVRVSSPSQKAHLSKQGKNMVAFGVKEENLLKIVSSARPKKPKSAGGPAEANPRAKKGLTCCQRQISSLLESLPPGSELVISTVSRLSRDYFFAVNAINAFYCRGCTLTIVRWKHNRSPKNPVPLKVEDLQLLYSDILGAERAADNIERGSVSGIGAAKAQGLNWGGSCKKLSEHCLLRLKEELDTTPFKRGVTFRNLQEKYQISRPSLYRYRQLFKVITM